MCELYIYVVGVVDTVYEFWGKSKRKFVKISILHYYAHIMRIIKQNVGSPSYIYFLVFFRITTVRYNSRINFYFMYDVSNFIELVEYFPSHYHEWVIFISRNLAKLHVSNTYKMLCGENVWNQWKLWTFVVVLYVLYD